MSLLYIIVRHYNTTLYYCTGVLWL